MSFVEMHRIGCIDIHRPVVTQVLDIRNRLLYFLQKCNVMYTTLYTTGCCRLPATHVSIWTTQCVSVAGVRTCLMMFYHYS